MFLVHQAAEPATFAAIRQSAERTWQSLANSERTGGRPTVRPERRSTPDIRVAARIGLRSGQLVSAGNRPTDRVPLTDPAKPLLIPETAGARREPPSIAGTVRRRIRQTAGPIQIDTSLDIQRQPIRISDGGRLVFFTRPGTLQQTKTPGGYMADFSQMIRRRAPRPVWQPTISAQRRQGEGLMQRGGTVQCLGEYRDAQRGLGESGQDCVGA